MLVKDAIKQLKTMRPNDHVAITWWNEEDMIERAREYYDTQITKAQAVEAVKNTQITLNEIDMDEVWYSIDKFIEHNFIKKGSA